MYDINKLSLLAVGGEYKNLYYRKHPTRKHGVKFDRYFIYRYTFNKELYVETVGWESEGHKPKDFYDTLVTLRNNRKEGIHPCSLKELREKQQNDSQDRLKLNQYWKIYYKQARATKKQSSYSREEQQFRLYISPVVGERFLDDISASHYQRILDTVQDKSPRTQKYILGTLRRVLLSAWDNKYLTKEPEGMRTVKIKKVNNERTRLITEEEKEFILQELKQRSPQAYHITQFCFLTGCRFGEAANLKWIDVTDTTITFKNTKNKDNREIGKSEHITELLDNLSPTNEFIFVMANGEQWKQPPETFKTIVNDFNTGREKNDKIVFHSIRHYVATQLGKYLTLKELQDVMGWKDPQMAMRYMKPDEKRQLKALSILGNKITSKVVRISG